MSRFDDILKKASATGEWKNPPNNLVADLLSKEPDAAPGRDGAAADSQIRNLKWTDDSAADVRSAPTVDLGVGPVTLTETFDEGELGLVVADTGYGGRWSMRGILWLHEAGDKPAKLIWLHEEHVITACDVENGVPFELEETVAAGWTLELHLPNRTVLELKNPAT